VRIAAGNLFYQGGAPEAFEDPRGWQRRLAWGKALGFGLGMWRQVALCRNHWNAVESHWLVPCGLLASALLADLPHRAHVHGGDLYLLCRLPCGDSLARSICRSRPLLVFASASLHERFVALIGVKPESLGARCQIDAAPFDASLFFRRSDDERAEARRALQRRRATLLAAGRLVPIKGFDVLLDALGCLPAKTRPDLVLAGEGPEKERLHQQALRLGIHVRLPGQLGQETLAQWMAAADLFVHPCRTLPSGRSEGMPLVVREALACGLPVVAAKSGGLGELQGTSGLALVAPDNAKALAEAIERALREIG
jgi:glycosyltransferase involved in cell wall biosynthesis